MSSFIDKEQDKFAEYRYQITEFIMLYDGEEEEFPLERIRDWKIEHDFEKATFPLFKFTLSMEASRYYKMIKNKDKVKFKVRIQYFYLTNGDPDKKSMLKDLINDKFVLFTDENSEDLEIDMKKEAETDKDYNELDQLLNDVELFLFKEHVTKLRSTCNVVLSSCNLTTAVTYLLGKAGVSKVLMSPLDNTSSYRLIIPPISIDRALQYLNCEYGFHKKGTLIYFGLLHSYILDLKGGCTAWYKKEWKDTNIFVFDKGNHDSSLSSCVLKKDEEKYYINAQPDGVQILSESATANATGVVGGNIVTIKSNSSAAPKVGTSLDSENKVSIFHATQNSYKSNTYAAMQKSNDVVISLSLENIDIESFNPNKNISMIFENATLNKKYKGTYRVSTAIHLFENSGADYTISSYIVLKKVA